MSASFVFWFGVVWIVCFVFFVFFFFTQLPQLSITITEDVLTVRYPRKRITTDGQSNLVIV